MSRTGGDMSRATVLVAATFVAGIAFALLAGRAAAKRVLTPEAMEKEATDIAVGNVSDIYMNTVETKRHGDGTVEERFLFEIQIEKVEKGGLTPGEVLYVRTWGVKSHPRGEGCGKGGVCFHGEFGHCSRPEVGDRVRAFVVRGPYEWGNHTDNGYTAVYPEGLVTLSDDAD